jgi:hypothetical protein
MIGDQDDLHVWRRKRNAWVERATGCIEARDASAVQAFRDAARVKRPLAGWQLAIPGELDALRAAVKFVRRLERAYSVPAGTGSATPAGPQVAAS